MSSHTTKPTSHPPGKAELPYHESDPDLRREMDKREMDEFVQSIASSYRTQFVPYSIPASHPPYEGELRSGEFGPDSGHYVVYVQDGSVMTQNTDLRTGRDHWHNREEAWLTAVPRLGAVAVVGISPESDDYHEPPPAIPAAPMTVHNGQHQSSGQQLVMPAYDELSDKWLKKYGHIANDGNCPQTG